MSTEQERPQSGNFSINIGNLDAVNIGISASDVNITHTQTGHLVQRRQVVVCGGVPTTPEAAKQLEDKISFVEAEVEAEVTETGRKMAQRALDYVRKQLTGGKRVDRNTLRKAMGHLAKLGPRASTAMLALLAEPLAMRILADTGPDVVRLVKQAADQFALR
ncbi:MAG: hypothetical protein AAF125_00430 [Chloroflexota bacterium]